MPDTIDHPVSGQLFRDAMSRVAGAVHVIATSGRAGLGGATATAVTSVSDAPPSLLLCLNKASQTLDRIRGNNHFSVNVLGARQEDVAAVFSGARGFEGADRFRPEHGWQMGGGIPVLAEALASFTCRLTDMTPVGSHMIVIGMVEQALIGAEAAPLLYHKRAYLRL